MDSGWQLRWTEAEDSLVMLVSQTGLPRSIHVHPAGGSAISLKYERWSNWNGVMWPSRLVGADADGRMTVTLQPQSMMLKARDPGGLPPLRTPHGAIRLSRARLLAWLSRLAGEAGPDSTGAKHP